MKNFTSFHEHLINKCLVSKKLLLFFGCFVSTLTFAQNINFADPDLKANLITQGIDTSNDGEIQVSEALAVTSLSVFNGAQITDMTGIEFFTSLTFLNIQNLQATSINISTMTVLDRLILRSPTLNALNLSNNVLLTDIRLDQLPINVLDLSTLTILEKAEINNVTFTTINLPSTSTLTDLLIFNASLTSINLSNLPQLEDLRIFNSSLTSIDFSNNQNLENISLESNNLISVDASMLPILRNISVADNSNLTTLTLTSLTNSTLTEVVSINTSLTDLSLTNFTGLQDVELTNSNLSYLNLKNGNNANIGYMEASGNPNLTCITVDDPSAAAGYTGWSKDTTAAYSAACRPEVTILGAPALTSAPFTAQFQFDRDVTGFTINDIVLTNATASNFVATSATLYSALITPTSTCAIDITIDVPQAAAQGVANGDDSEPATQVVVQTEDTINPVAIAQNISVNLDANGNATITPSQVDNGSTDNCAVYLFLDISGFDCTNVGANTVTLTAEDDESNTDTATAIVTVIDNMPPTISCQNVTVNLDANGDASIAVADVLTSATDNCGVTNFTLDTTTFTCADIGANTVTLTAIDVNGNSATCTATVTVNDTTSPAAVCQNISVLLDANGSATITEADINNGSTDNCSLTYTLNTNTFDCNDIGNNTVMLTATDSAGNTSTCSALVTVADDLSPTVQTNDITVQLDATGTATLVASDIDNNSTDNCAIDTLTIDVTAFSCSDVGTNTVTLTATDASGNSGSATAVVTVEDNVAPTVACQDITVQLDAFGDASIAVADLLTGSADNCGVTTFAINTSSFGCDDLGNNSVTLTATDVNGNTATCTSIVTVEDNIAPTATCQNITVQLDATGVASIVAADIDNGSTDNCAINALSIDISNFDCDDIGINNVVLTVTDNAGNSSTCSGVVTLVDDVSPIVSCPPNQTVSVDPNIGFEVPDYLAINEASATDNCTDPITLLSQSPAAGTFLAVGSTYSIIVNAEDASGNQSSCSFNVDVTEILGVDDYDLAHSFNIYPNPVEATFRIDTDKNITNMSIYNINGQLVKTFKNPNENYNVKDLNAGLYFVNITTEQGSATKKLIKN